MMDTYLVVFEVVVDDAESEDAAVEEARQLVSNPNFLPTTVEPT